MTTAGRKRILALTGTLLIVLPISAIAANWQWNRHLAREARNQQIELAASTLVTPYPGPLADGFQDTDRYRKLTVTGSWLPDEELYVRKTVVNGSVGFGVMTPFRADTGEILFVQRGWNDQPTSTAVAAGPTRITVRIQAAQGDGPMRPADLPVGQINWIDPNELSASRPHDAATFELIEPSPADLVPLPAPTTSSGPHVGYTIHWMLIGIAAIIIYIRLLRSEIYGVTEN